MIHGLYTSAWGALASQLRHEVIANNIANVNTTGYRPDWSVLRSYPNLEELAGKPERPDRKVLWSAGGGGMVAETRTTGRSGPVRWTGRDADLALHGDDGYFVLEREGVRHFTRAGDFTLNGKGVLVSADGSWTVQGESGPLALGRTDFTVGADGTVSQLDDNNEQQVVGRLQLVRFEHPDQLVKVGENQYEAPEEAGLAAAGDRVSVEQGALEMSGTNAAEAMVQMIEAFRAYEANMQMVRAQDGLLGQAVSQIARIG